MDHQQLRTILAANLNQELRDRKWSQRELARRSGVSFNTISRISRGIVMPSLLVVQRFAKTFDCSIDSLLK